MPAHTKYSISRFDPDRAPEIKRVLKQLLKLFKLVNGFYAIAQLLLRQTGECIRMILEPKQIAFFIKMSDKLTNTAPKA